jgi:hypothetical protein
LIDRLRRMGAATALPVRDVRVDPGATTTAKMLVRNTGQVVDQYAIDVVGNCAPWTRVEPAVVNLLPGADVEVTITFAPERSPQVPAGVVAFGVRVLSREDPPGSAVAEGSVDVAPFDDTQVELVPRQSKGRRRGKHQVAIDNNGNVPALVEVTAQDEEEALDFRFDHRNASIEPGAAAFIRLTAKPEKRFFKGADRQHPFVVTVVPSNATPIATRGTMTQRQLLPGWLIPAIAVLAALAIAAVVLYYTLLKPAIKSTAADAAKSAVKSQNKSLASKASKAESQAAAANAQAKKAQAQAANAQQQASSVAKNGASGGGGGGGIGGGTGPSGTKLDAGTATSFTMSSDAAPTKNNFTKFSITQAPPIPANKVLVVTAMVMQNPNGDTGTMQIQRGSAETLLTEGLANFRDLDQHFDNEPIVFTKDKPLRIAVNCQAASAVSTHCHPSILFTGRVATKPKT